MKIIKWLFLYVLAPAQLWAQTPYFLPLNRSNDLPTDIVFDIFEDSRGLVWLATNEGLFRYDGNYFSPFSTRNQTSKPGTDIAEDRFGRIWYQNFDGHLFYVEHEMLHELSMREGLTLFNYGLLEDVLIVAYKDKVVTYDLESLKEIRLTPMNGQLSHLTYCTQNAFYVFEDDGKEAVQFEFTRNSFERRGKSAEIKMGAATIVTDRGAKVAAVSKYGDNQKVYSISQQTGETEVIFSIDEPRFYQNLIYLDNKYWLCSTGGLFVYTEDGRLENNAPYFPGVSVSNVMKDSFGNYWISSLHEGVFIVRDFKSTLVETTGMKINRITKFNNEILVGMKNGEMYTLGKNGIKQRVYKSQNDHGIYFLDGEESDDALFLTGSGFSVLDRNFKSIFPTSSSLKDIESIGEGYYAVAISGYAGILNVNGSDNTPWSKVFQEKQLESLPMFASLFSCRGRSVAYSHLDTVIFFATNIGMFRSTPYETNSMTEGGKPLFAEQIDVIKRHLFIRTTDGKILCRRADKPHVSLPVGELNNMNWIKMKRFGESIILMSDTRFMKVDLQNGELVYKELIARHPLDDVNDYLFDGDELSVASDDGVYFINVNGVKPNVSPKFITHEILINGLPEKIKNEYRLEESQNNLEIRFSFLQFPGIEEKQLEFTTDGRNWLPLNISDGKLIVGNLSSGTYHLMIRNKDEIYLDVLIDVAFPIWARWWFVLILVLVFSGLVYLYFKNRTNILLKQNMLLQEKIDLEKDLQDMMMRSIKSQMNPHFFYNALNTIQSFIFTDDKKNAGIYLSKFSKLTRLILEMSNQESVSLSEELNALRIYLDIEKVRFRDDFVFSIHVDEVLDIDDVYLPSMLVQPYVENAIRHGLLHKRGQKVLFVGFYKKDTNLEIVIEDNGIGREKSRELNSMRSRGHQSFASAANSRRVEILNRVQGNPGVTFVDKHDAAGHAEGTIVKIIIPISDK
ncbi:MAG: histidine kinase [Flavobacteriales bacterium]